MTDSSKSSYEAILLAPNEPKIESVEDTRIPNCRVFTFHKEDMTLGNLLSVRCLKHTNVLFSAVRVPHPLTPNFELRIQTDGTITPRDLVITVSNSIIRELGQLSREFTKEFELAKMAKAANQQQANE
ncbi:DNA-directed RNA polymerase II subunit [Penicillium verhagenii]|nr:DNA-directed RNA polymerase II subunit [Penicillium verhagenii]